MMPAPPPAPPVPIGVPAALWAWLWLLVQLYIKLLLLIWITTIHTCRGTVFGNFAGRAAIVIASVLVANTTPKMLAAWVTLTNLMQCPDMRRLRADWNILTRSRKHGPKGQSGVIDEAASKALVVRPARSCTSAPIVDTLTAYKLIQHSQSQNEYVTGDAIALTNVIMDGMGLGPNSYIDAAMFTSSATHLVLSDATLRECVPKVICAYCGFGQIARKATRVTPDMAKAFAAAADDVRDLVVAVAAAFKNRDAVELRNLLDRLKARLRELDPGLAATYTPAARRFGTVWTEVMDNAQRQGQIDTPHFWRLFKQRVQSLQRTDLVIALGPSSFEPSEPHLLTPTVLLVKEVKFEDFILSTSREYLGATLLSPLVCFAAVMLADGENNLEVFPPSESPRTALRVAMNMLAHGSSLVESRGASLHAMEPGTDEVLFRSERQNVGWEPFTGDQLRARGREITTLGAHANYCKIVRAEEGARVTTLALELAAQDAHEIELVNACEEAHARGLDPSLIVLTYQAASGAGSKLDAKTAASRAFENRCKTELRLADCGAVVMRLESVAGHCHMTIADLDELIADVVPKRFQALRDRAILVLPKNHVYVEEASGLGSSLIRLFGRRARIVSDSVVAQLEAVSESEWKLTSTRCGRRAGVAPMALRHRRRRDCDGVVSTASRRRHRVDGVATMASRRWRRDDGVDGVARESRRASSLRCVFTQDASFLEDLDAPQVEEHKPFLKLEGERLAAWLRGHPSHPGNIPSSVFNGNGAFKLVTDVSSSKEGLRSGGTDDLEPVGDFLLKDCSSMKKQPFNFEKLLLPNGPEFDDDYKSTASENAVPISSYSLPALKATLKHFNGELQRYNDAVSAGTAKGFEFDWRGHNVGSQKSLQRALRCKAFQGAAAKRVEGYVGVLDAKIKEFKAAAAAA